MSRVETVATMDRLPWLPDEAPPSARGGGAPGSWAAAAFVLVAGTGLWIGARSSHEQVAGHDASTTTVRLPPVRKAPEAAVAPVLGVIQRDDLKRPAARMTAISAHPATRAASRRFHHSALAKSSPTPVIRNALGPVIEIGAFGSPDQASRGWRSVVRAHPNLAHLPTQVSKSRNSKGRSYYRVEVRTGSQGRSYAPCQGLRKIGLSCAVVGRPTEAKR